MVHDARHGHDPGGDHGNGMCGNVTILGRVEAAEPAAFPTSAQRLLRRMVHISQMRGAQSGGGAVQIAGAGSPRQIIEKCVNSKRGDLATRMTRRLASATARKAAFGSSFVVQTHVRYATAGLTSRYEAHPFRFVDVRDRGLRRVTEFENGRPHTTLRPIETALTHNGDLDGMRCRGTLIPFPELGTFLERILGVRNRWVGDSPQLAAAIELYVTRGMWFEALRLAHHLTVTPAPGPVVRASPSHETLHRWEALAERTLDEVEGSFPDPDPAAARRQRQNLSERLAAAFGEGGAVKLPKDRMKAFTRAAVDAFFDNDLYVALRKLEPSLEGTFGCVVTSTLEPGTAVALSRGQPLSLGFRRSSGLACIVSERAAIKVEGEGGRVAFDERLDLDLCRGEIARIEIDSGRLGLTLYGISDGREYGADELVAAGRLVPLRGNPYVSELPVEPEDRVEADVLALGAFLDGIRRVWHDPASPNVQTARAFANALFRRASPAVLVIGITNDLWLAEQFASNLGLLFPGVRVEAKSSNEILRDEGALGLDENTLVLAVSQSGQDFPTLGALLLLQQRVTGGREDAFFVLTGDIDSLMGQAVGQSYGKGAQFSQRIFSNLTGFRPSEAAIVTVNATHHTLVELLLCLARWASDRGSFPELPHGYSLEGDAVTELALCRDRVIDVSAGAITGKESSTVGATIWPALSPTRRWSRHLLEGAVAFLVVVLVLEANLQLGLGLLPSSVLGAFAPLWPEPAASWLTRALSFVGPQADVAFYAFLGPLALWLTRRIQLRPVLHRQGVRELLIGDTGYVHKIAWLLARRLFSLSYGFASVKAYSADCQDELILTHEPLRGTLALIGIPDARRPHLRGRGSAALMTAKQFNNSRSFAGAGAEIVTVGHGTSATAGVFAAHLAVPHGAVTCSNPRLDVLVEQMFDSWERLMVMQVFLARVAARVSSFGPFRYDRSRTKDQVFAPTTAAPVSAAAIYQLLSRSSERYERYESLALPFEVQRSEWRASAPSVKTRVWRVQSGEIQGSEE